MLPFVCFADARKALPICSLTNTNFSVAILYISLGVIFLFFFSFPPFALFLVDPPLFAVLFPFPSRVLFLKRYTVHRVQSSQFARMASLQNQESGDSARLEDVEAELKTTKAALADVEARFEDVNRRLRVTEDDLEKAEDQVDEKEEKASGRTG